MAVGAIAISLPEDAVAGSFLSGFTYLGGGSLLAAGGGTLNLWGTTGQFATEGKDLSALGTLVIGNIADVAGKVVGNIYGAVFNPVISEAFSSTVENVEKYLAIN